MTLSVTKDYRVSMRRRGLRPGSIDARMSVVVRWLEYAGERWTDSPRELVEEWLDTRDLAARSRYCQISHLHQFYKWARREGLCQVDPTDLIERPRLPRRLPRPARRSGVDFAIAVADREMAVMLTLMVDAGLRCCEVAALTWGDVDLEAGTMHVTGKGGAERVVGIPARLAGVLEGGELVGPVIGRKLTPARVSQLVGPYLRSCGVDATAHQLRHLYATRLLSATHDITAVQQALGHASITSTQIYALVDPTQALDAARDLV